MPWASPRALSWGGGLQSRAEVSPRAVAPSPAAPARPAARGIDYREIDAVMIAFFTFGSPLRGPAAGAGVGMPPFGVFTGDHIRHSALGISCPSNAQCPSPGLIGGGQQHQLMYIAHPNAE